MKSYLFALGLALCCVVQAEWKEVTTISNQDMGPWISFAVACNSSFCLDQIRNMSAFIAEVSQPEEGVFSIRIFIHMPDGCKDVTYQYKKGEDGKYRSFYDDSVVTVESVKAKNEYVMSIINVNNEFRTATLHGRKVTQDPEILQNFNDECKKLGYKEDEIVVLNPTGNAIQSRKVAGNWYPLASIVIEKQFPQYTLKAEPKGDLMYTFNSLENGQCKTRQLPFTKYQTPGKFKTSSPTFGQIVDTDYETYLIIYFILGLDTFLTLDGRQQNLTPDLETKFKNVAASAGITGEVVPVVLK
ncbi:uncharacterized protein LOC107302513, partial [Protobothrops mucrosquamatus]|uniref:uncharacterized protein LOC107302513 n=1 Tax=Protobothrops mucrosquamatus TaxID=103944 RepID=UPI0007757202